MIKIVYLSDARIPSEMASSVSIINLCSAYYDIGVDIDLIKPWRYINKNIKTKEIYKIYNVQNNINIINTPYIDLSIFEKILPKLILKPANYIIKRIWQYYSVNYILKKFSPDIIHMRNNMPYALNLLSKKKIHILLEFYDEPSKFYIPLYKKSIKENNKIILTAITSSLADRISELFEINRKSISVSPSGVDKSKFAHHKLQLNTNTKTILYVGSLNPNRGIDNFILASKNIKEHNFIIVGGTENEATNLKNKFDINEGSNLIFVPHQKQSELLEYYNNSDILILPMSGDQKHTRLFASPNKLFEYMASGKPIIASNLPSVCEILKDYNSALLFQPDDPIDLTKKINELINNNELSKKLSSNAMNLAEKYTWQAKASNFIKLIQTNIN